MKTFNYTCVATRIERERKMSKHDGRITSDDLFMNMESFEQMIQDSHDDEELEEMMRNWKKERGLKRGMEQDGDY